MDESSGRSRCRFRGFLTFCCVALCAMAGAQGPTGSASSLADQPTSITSRPERLVIYQDWPPGDTNARKYLLIVPPNRALQPEAVEAQIESHGPASAALTTQTLPQPVQWINTQRDILTALFTHKPIGYFRHYRVIEVRVNPIFKVANQSYRARRLGWAYRWEPPYVPEKKVDEATRREDGGFGSVLAQVIANPEAFALYGDPNPPPGQMPPALEGQTFGRLAAGQRPLFRLSVEDKALFRLDRDWLKLGAGGTTPSLERLHLFNKGQPVPLYLAGDRSRPGQPAEMIFYGVDSDSPYTRTNRYWLAEDASRQPVRMTVASVDPAWKALPPEESFPEALVIEQDNDLIIHADNFLTISEFRWVWGEIPPTDQREQAAQMVAEAPKDKAWFTSATFALPGLADSQEGQARLAVSFYYSETRLPQPVRVAVRINGGQPHSVALKEPEDQAASFTLPSSALRETSNTIDVIFESGQLPQGASVYLDRLVAHYRRRFEVPEQVFAFSGDAPTTAGWRHYALGGKLPARPLVLDVANTAQPRVVEFETDAKGLLHFGQKETRAARYRLLSLDQLSTPTAEPTTDLQDLALPPADPVDYLIISHRDFIDLLAPLVACLQQAGWRVLVVDVENVYASFSWGLSGPGAIKEFLAHALRHWPGGGPGYVLLVGDSTSDYRGVFRNQVKNYVPTYSLDRGARIEKWASEHWFTTLCGDDDYSDIILGRLSVNSRDDAKTVIDKIVRYRTEPVLGPWRMTSAYVADRGSFDDDAEHLRLKYKSPAMVGRRIYLDDFPWEDNFYLPPEIVEADKAKVSPVTTTRILEMFNRGATFVSYRGHGSPNIWSNERIWFGGDSPNSDIRMLRNGERLPFITNLTCNSGAIDYPDPPWNLCISEDFMRSPTGGAIGLFVPTGPGIPAHHIRLSEEFHTVLYGEDSADTAAATGARSKYRPSRALGDMVQLTKWRYLLQGNPLVVIQMYLFLGEPSCPMQMPNETFALEVEPPVISAPTGGRVRVSGRSPLGEGQQGLIALFSPRDEQQTSAPLRLSGDGRFEHTFNVAVSDEAGTWTARAYCWSPAAKRDAVGWAQVLVAQPDVLLAGLKIERSGAIRAGDPTTFTYVVANRAPLPAKNLQVKLYRDTGRRKFLLEQADLALAPNQTQQRRFVWKAEPGCFVFEAQLSGPPEMIGRPAPGSARKTVDLAVVGGGEGAPVALVPAPISVQFSRAANRFTRRSELRLGCLTGKPPSEVTVTLVPDPGTSETRKLTNLVPGEIQSLAFQDQVVQPLLPGQYGIILRWPNVGTTQTARQETTIRVAASDFPDLTIQADQITMRDEANAITFHDSTPTDGHTVFFDVPVKNIGGAAATGPFSLEAFDGDPTRGGQPLRLGIPPSDTPARVDIPHLEAGETKTVRLRWDPFHNAGPHPIFFRLDGNHRVTESNELNNETSRTLQVLAKGKLATGKIRNLIQTPEERRKRIFRLAATVMNDGETTVRQVLVEVYLGPQTTPPNLIGEAMIDQLGPKSLAEAIVSWNNPSDADIKRVLAEKFSFLARLKGSWQRVISTPQD